MLASMSVVEQFDTLLRDIATAATHGYLLDDLASRVRDLREKIAAGEVALAAAERAAAALAPVAKRARR